ncbi:MAG: HAD family hydrolase [Huintestinicola sp.]
MKAESIIFDMDGTLWDSADNVAESWNEAIRLSGNPMLRNTSLTGADIKRVMGLPMDVLTEQLFPTLSTLQRAHISEKCAERENEYLASHGGTLFEGVEETLAQLSKNHRLFIVSNCQTGYIEAFFEYFGFAHLFTDYLCWGDTGKEKNVTISRLMKKNSITSAVYIGDTAGDMAASEKAGIPFVFAGYGFGRLPADKKPTASISSFSDLITLFE